MNIFLLAVASELPAHGTSSLKSTRGKVGKEAMRLVDSDDPRWWCEDGPHWPRPKTEKGPHPSNSQPPIDALNTKVACSLRRRRELTAEYEESEPRHPRLAIGPTQINHQTDGQRDYRHHNSINYINIFIRHQSQRRAVPTIEAPGTRFAACDFRSAFGQSQSLKRRDHGKRKTVAGQE